MVKTFRAILALGAIFVGLSVSAALAQNARITFLHLNDVYVLEGNGGSGLAALATLAKRERSRAGGNALMTFGGDLISPSLLSSLTRGRHMIEMMNAIGVQFAVLGNHEFDFGLEVLRERVAESRFPWLAANVRDLNGASLSGVGDTRLVTLNGVKIGMFGVVSPETRLLSLGGSFVRFGPPLEVARRAVADLAGQGAEVIVALTHLGLDDDLELAREIPEIDLVLGGHEHYLIAIAQSGALVVKGGQNADYLSAVDIEVRREAGGTAARIEVRPVQWRFVSTRGVPPDPAVAEMIDRTRARFDPALDETVGNSATALDLRTSVVRGRESNFGNLLTDAMRSATGADIALYNGGGIRGDRIIPPGRELSRRDLTKALPFKDTVVVLEIDGAALRQALELGVSTTERLAGRFLQVSGVRFSWDRAGAPGARVRDVAVGSAPLDLQQTYRVAAGAYISGGGDGYAMLKAAKRIPNALEEHEVAGLLIDYLIRKAIVAPAIDGRIREIQ